MINYMQLGIRHELAEKAKEAELSCRSQRVNLLIYCGKRSIHSQARLYRKSRTYAQILKKVKSLDSQGFHSLAAVLLGVGPQAGELGKHVTMAAPGESWHNYGLAFDAVPLVNGKPAWNYEEASEAWDIYGQAVRDSGLVWAGDWTNFKELPHSQLREGSNPLKVLTPQEVVDYTGIRLKA